MLKLRMVELILIGISLAACSVQSSNFSNPVLGTCNEFSYNKRYSVPTYVTLPLRGEITSAATSVRIEIKSNLNIPGYPILDCNGQENKTRNEEVITLDLICQNGVSGTAFINFVHDKEDLGDGQFSLTNGTVGVFQFGYKLLLSSQT